jgi:prepilin-type N-terminal cleavage/methylation domain-containing protein
VNKIRINNNRFCLSSRRNRKANKMKTKMTRKSGFTLVEIMIVVAIIGLLAAIAIPNFVKARTTAQQNACINNLRQIDGAKQQWAIELKKAPTETPGSAEIEPYVKSTPECPASGAGWPDYDILSVSENPACTVLGGDLNTPHILPTAIAP